MKAFTFITILFLSTLSSAEVIFETKASDKTVTPISLKEDAVYPQCKPNAPCEPIIKGYNLTVRTISYGGCNKVDSIFYRATSVYNQDQVLIFYKVQDKNATHIINDEGGRESVLCHTGKSPVDVTLYLDANDFFSSKPRMDNIVLIPEIKQSTQVTHL